MAPPVTAQPTFTIMPCGPTGMPIQAGLLLLPTSIVSPPSDHAVAIALGVGIPGGLLLVIILVFIVFILRKVQRLKARSFQDDCESATEHQRRSIRSQSGFQSRQFSTPPLQAPSPSPSQNQYTPRPFTMHTLNGSLSSQTPTGPPSYHSSIEAVYDNSTALESPANTAPSYEAQPTSLPSSPHSNMDFKHMNGVQPASPGLSMD